VIPAKVTGILTEMTSLSTVKVPRIGAMNLDLLSKILFAVLQN